MKKTNNLITIFCAILFLTSCKEEIKVPSQKKTVEEEIAKINPESMNLLIQAYNFSQEPKEIGVPAVYTTTTKTVVRGKTTGRPKSAIKFTEIVKPAFAKTKNPFEDSEPFDLSINTFQPIHFHCCENEEFTILAAVNGSFDKEKKRYQLDAISFKLENDSNQKMYLKKGSITDKGRKRRNIKEGDFNFYDYNIILTDKKEESEDIITINNNNQVFFYEGEFIDAHLKFNDEDYKKSKKCVSQCKSYFYNKIFEDFKPYFTLIDKIDYFNTVKIDSISPFDIKIFKKDSNYVKYSFAIGKNYNIKDDIEKIKLGYFLYEANVNYQNNAFDKIWLRPYAKDWWEHSICRRWLIFKKKKKQQVWNLNQ